MRRLYRAIKRWWMMKKWAKMREERIVTPASNRAERRKTARRLAGHDGDVKGIYEALKSAEKR